MRDCVGLAGTIRSLSGFAMKSFNTAGQTVIVQAQVERNGMEDGVRLVEIATHSRTGAGITVGPGNVVASLPLK